MLYAIMKTLIINIVLLSLTNQIFGQLSFNKSNVSDKILTSVYALDEVTSNPNFENIDSLRSEYSDLIWIKLPYANDVELKELTNYKNKFVRLQAFDLLLNWRKNKNHLVLQILEKNINDTIDKVDKLEGCLLYNFTVYERMLDMTKNKVDYEKEKNRKSYFTKEENLKWIELRKLIKG